MTDGNGAQRTWGGRATFALVLLGALLLALGSCSDDDARSVHPHGPIAEGVSAPLGEPIPSATSDQLEQFAAGSEVSLMRFGLTDGLGPAFNVTFCTACHERPVNGGSAALYRNFFIAGTELEDGSFVFAESQGPSGGVVRMYSYAGTDLGRPAIPEDVNVIAQRNPIPFFGVGLLADVADDEILSRADPDDQDGDGISGRANFDRGFVGRFGRKAQTVSIEGFIRGPLFNHLGITTDPLSNEMRALLPVDSSAREAEAASAIKSFIQAAAPDGPTTDDDGVPDPELSAEQLFDLVSFTMLLAAPELEDPGEQAIRGASVFDDVGCGVCHTPRIASPSGPLPVYSDLLLHDMGPELADGLVQGVATGSEFRTQPLWGLAPVGPYLHDGRAESIEDAILMHGGEAEGIRDRAAALSDDEMADLIEFLESLGGRSQYSPGRIATDEQVPSPGDYGGPVAALSESEQELFLAGRSVFDQDGSFDAGVGTPRFNGDSCRACHFDPVPGGSGPAGVNVMRHGTLVGGKFIAPSVGTILHKELALLGEAIEPEDGVHIFEHRQTPTLLGLGLIDGIPGDVIAANADPDDADGDGISGRVSMVNGQVGRLGWKAQVPSLIEFIRDAVGAEMGMTMEPQSGITFGITEDDDDVADPEFSLAQADRLLFFLSNLAPPPRLDPDDPLVREGEQVFERIGCSSCHVASLQGAAGPVELYSDLLLHEILPAGSLGIADGSASMLEFRTPPLWGLRDTAPYLHNGSADTFEQAVRGHDGEAATVRDAYLALSAEELEAIEAFLGSL